MDIRSLREAGFISRFIHILLLATVVAPGVVFRSHTMIAALTVVWFILFAAVYLFLKPRRR